LIHDSSTTMLAKSLYSASFDDLATSLCLVSQ